MSLPSGARLGVYEITAFLGAGAIGEVYRARDTRLDRRVAIKVLAPALAAEPQLRERFEREARARSRRSTTRTSPVTNAAPTTAVVNWLASVRK